MHTLHWYVGNGQQQLDNSGFVRGGGVATQQQLDVVVIDVVCVVVVSVVVDAPIVNFRSRTLPTCTRTILSVSLFLLLTPLCIFSTFLRNESD